MGYWRHLGRTEGVPGEERIVELLGYGERSEVSWLTPFGISFRPREVISIIRMKRTLERNPIGKRRLYTLISAKINNLGISPSCDGIGRTRTLVQGVDTAKRIDVFLEIG